jgi:large subunit ribosomal protein L28
MGNQVTHRGKAKYLGGVGTKITGITRRKFKPNLQRVKVSAEDGGHKRMRVCTQCLRSGAVVKKMKAAPFQLPEGEMEKARAREAEQRARKKKK